MPAIKPIALVAFLAAATIAFAQETTGPARIGESSLGAILVGPDGMTLYAYDNDEPGQPPPRMGLPWIAGVSNCYDQCAANWPPFLVDDIMLGGGSWMAIRRTDGTSMWAYLGKPLYYYVNDTEPGDVTGDGIGGVWQVVRVQNR